jgi:hypothetical protein
MFRGKHSNQKINRPNPIRKKNIPVNPMTIAVSGKERMMKLHPKNADSTMQTNDRKEPTDAMKIKVSEEERMMKLHLKNEDSAMQTNDRKEPIDAMKIKVSEEERMMKLHPKNADSAMQTNDRKEPTDAMTNMHRKADCRIKQKGNLKIMFACPNQLTADCGAE